MNDNLRATISMSVCRVLIIDDNADDRSEARRLLLQGSGRRYKFTEAETASAGIRLCLENKDALPDCVLLDYYLPDGDAIDVLEALIGEDGLSICPVVVITGSTDVETSRAILRAGAQDYIGKSWITSYSLTRVIETAAERWAMAIELKKSELKFRHLAFAVPLAIWVADTSGKLDYVNDLWLHYFGERGKACLTTGKWRHLVRLDNLGRRSLSAYHLKTMEEPFQIECRLLRADGEYRWHQIRVVPVRDNTGKIFQWYGSNTDIHDLKEGELVLQQAKIGAEQADRAKSQFLANMSHEIRNPLGSIIGFAELLRDTGPSNDDHKLYLDTITRNSHLLNRLIDDILDVSKVEAGKLDIEMIDMSLPLLLKDIAETLTPKASEKGLSLIVRPPVGIPPNVRSDPTRLKQILLNIVGNAIKFTDHGSVRLETILANSIDEEPGFAHIMFRVADTGLGLSVAQRSKLFTPFVQAERSTTRMFGGTGLGLVLSRHLCRLLGGDLTIAHSEVGVGSVFEIKIKMQILSENLAKTGHSSFTSAETLSSHQPPILHAIRVLVADDSSDSRFLVGRMLSEHGATVEYALDGAEAVERALTGNYDLVFMDVQMPRLDGLEATKEIRRLGFRKPILALTANAMRGEREASINAGCTDHITKPLFMHDLVSRVAHHLGCGNRSKLDASRSDYRAAPMVSRNRGIEGGFDKNVDHSHLN